METEHRFRVKGYTRSRYDVVYDAPDADAAMALLAEDISNDAIRPTSTEVIESEAKQICRHEPGDPGDDTHDDADEKPE